MAKPKNTPSAQDVDAYYSALLEQKIAAGLPADTAADVTARQRAEDEANGVIIPTALQDAEPQS